MKKGMKIGIGIAAIVGVVAVSMVAASRADSGGAMVRMEPVATRDLVATVTASGWIRPHRRVEVQADIMGRIIELNVKEGDVVQRGQVLLRIDPTQFEAAVSRAQAAVSEALAREAQTKANLLQAAIAVVVLWPQGRPLVYRLPSPQDAAAMARAIEAAPPDVRALVVEALDRRHVAELPVVLGRALGDRRDVGLVGVVVRLVDDRQLRRALVGALQVLAMALRAGRLVHLLAQRQVDRSARNCGFAGAGAGAGTGVGRRGRVVVIAATGQGAEGEQGGCHHRSPATGGHGRVAHVHVDLRPPVGRRASAP